MPRWTTRQGSPIIAEPCEGTWAVHLVASGMTHLVDQLSGEVLLFLAPAIRTESEILAFVKEASGDGSITIVGVTEQWLRPLEAIGLVEEVV